MTGQQWERPVEAVATLLSLYGQDLTSEQRILLLREYAVRIRGVETRQRNLYNEELMALIAQRGLRSTVVAPSAEYRPVDVAILTVQPIELRAVLHYFGNPEVARVVDGRKYYEVRLTSRASAVKTRPLRVVIAATMNPYNVRNAVAVAEVARAYSPRLWVLVGMAAGLQLRVNRGDVVLPAAAWYYEPGRLMPSSFEPRPELAVRGEIGKQLFDYDTGSTSFVDAVHAALHSLPERYRPKDLRADFFPEVSLRSDAVASGEKLLRDGGLLESLHHQNERVVIGDQESYGFAVSCGEVEWLVARGVADYGDEEKNDDWQFLATLMATCATIHFLENHYTAPDLVDRF